MNSKFLLNKNSNAMNEKLTFLKKFFLGIFALTLLFTRLHGEVHTEGQMKAIMKGVAAPGAPSDLSAKELSDSKIKLSWTDNSDNEEGFGILRSTDGVTFTQIDSVETDVTSYQDMGLSDSTEYSYRVFAYSISGNSDTTDIASATTQITIAPTAQTPLYDWNFEADSIILDEGPLKKDLTNNGSIATGGTEPNPPGYGSVGADLDGTTQYFSLSADDYGDHALHGTDTDGTIYVAVKLRTITMKATKYFWSIYSIDGERTLSMSYRDAKLSILWGRNEGAAYQTIYLNSYTLQVDHDIIIGLSLDAATRNYTYMVKDITAGEYHSINQDTTGLWEGHYSDSKADMVIAGRHGPGGLTDGTFYFTKIYDVAHSPDQMKAVMDGEAIPLGAPTNLKATTGSDSHVNLEWIDYAIDELGFVLERSTDGVTFAPYDTLDANTSFYQDLGLDESTEYSYMLYAYYADENSDTTDVVSATTEATMPIPDNDPVFNWNMEADSIILDEGTALTDLHNIGDVTTGGVEPNPPGYGTVGAVLDGSTQYFQLSDSEYGDRALNSIDIDGTIYIAFQAAAIPSSTAYLWSKYSTSDNQRQLALTVTSTGKLQLLWGFKNGTAYQKLVIPQVFSANQDIIVALSLNVSKKEYTYTAFDVAGSEYYTMTQDTTGLWGQNNKGTADMVIGGRHGGAGLFNGTIYWARIYDEAHTEIQMRSIIENSSLPEAPSGISATTMSSRQIDLTWTDNSDNEAGFGIERSEDGVTFVAIDSADADITSYQDTGLVASTEYFYRTFAYNSVGNSNYSDTASITTQTSGYQIIETSDNQLIEAYPNPFSETATLSYTLQKAADITIDIYNVTGMKVKTLTEGKKQPGSYTTTWDALDNSGNSLSDGVYFCVLKANGIKSCTNKLVLRR